MNLCCGRFGNPVRDSSISGSCPVLRWAGAAGSPAGSSSMRLTKKCWRTFRTGTCGSAAKKWKSGRSEKTESGSSFHLLCIQWIRVHALPIRIWMMTGMRKPASAGPSSSRRTVFMMPVQIMIMITNIPIRFLFPPAIWFGWTRRSMRNRCTG